MSLEISRLLQRPWFQLLMVMTGVMLKAVAYMRADISPEHFIVSNRGKYSSSESSELTEFTRENRAARQFNKENNK